MRQQGEANVIPPTGIWWSPPKPREFYAPKRKRKAHKANTLDAVRNRVKRKADRMGIDLKYSRERGLGCEVEAAAPIGMRFAGTQTHFVVAADEDGYANDYRDCWLAIEQDIAYGIEDCPRDCDCQAGQ